MKKSIFVGLMSISLGAALLLHPSNACAQTAASVTVTTNSLGTTQIPTNFLGFSMEWQYAQDYFGTTAAPNNVFFQLMKNLGGGVVRIGGNSTDEWCWDSGPSECQHQLTSGMINSIFNASAQTGFGIIAGINLTDGSTTNTVDTAKAFVNYGLNAYPGSTLIGAEIGNEPDLFDTSTNTDDATYPSSYTIGDNESDYKKMLTAMQGDSVAKTIPWVGPAFAGGWDSQLSAWISAVQGDGVGSSIPNPALITLHNYPLSNCGSDAGTGTIAGLLSASAMTSHASTYAGYESTVASKGWKLRIAETNSSACGGSPGVSEVQAAALWAMDDMFHYAQSGIVGVNFHGGGTSTSNGEDYSAVFTTGSNGQGTASQGATVAPLYYGMLMFANATGKYFLPTTVSTSDNIVAYSVAANASANPEVFVINKDTSASGVVNLKPTENFSSATLLLEEGTSLSDTNPTYGGVHPSASTGAVPSLNTTSLTPNANGVFSFTLPNAAAALITLNRGTPTPTPTPVVASTWRVDAGGAAYTDGQGNVWAADENYTGGTAAVTTSTISNSPSGTLYDSQRYGSASSFSYTFNVPAGSYQVSLLFAETYFTAAGDREFNVSINGATELTNFDPYAAAGGQNMGVTEVFNNISPSGGTITLNFAPGAVNNPEVMAIQIIPQPATATPTATYTPTQVTSTTPTSTPTLTPTYTFTSAATATYTPTTVASKPHPPYPVICYALETTKAPTNTVTDNGQGAAINWTTDVPWQDITIVCDAFAIPSTGDTFDMSETKESALITPAHANGVRCILSIGGGSQDSAFSTLCASANRAAFASAVTAQMMKYGYDGVDIDWESNTNQQSDATAMMEDLYRDVKALPNSTVDNLPRTLSFTTVNYIAGIYNMTTLGNYTDWCFFMGYDWGDCTTKATGPLNAIATEIQSLTDGATWSYPISKMVMGMPFYADYYTDNCNDTTDWDTLSILKLGIAGTYNSAIAEQQYTVNGDTVEVDVAQSFCDKTNWALNNHLMGIGMWDMGNALPYTDSTVSGIWNTIGGQASCLNLGPTATPTKTATPVVASTWRVDAGGAAYTDGLGNVWAADENYSGGTAAVTTNTISNTTSGTLYDSQRYGSAASFSYTFNVPAGAYQVSLLFAETYFTAAGSREFNVSINGTTELTNFDIYATAGGQNKAVTEIYNNISPSGGTITLTFAPGADNNPEVNAIQIIPMPATATNTPTQTHTATLTSTYTTSSTPTSSPTGTWTSTLTATLTATNSPTATLTTTSSPTWTGTAFATATNSATAVGTASAAPTNSATAVSTASATASFTTTTVFTSTPSSTSTVVLSATATNSATAVDSPTGTPTSSPTAIYTGTLVNTATPTLTSTSTPVLTATLTNSATPVNTTTSTWTFSSTPTWTGTPTSSPTGTATRTFTALPTSSPTGTATPTATFSFTPTWTHTAVRNTATFTPTVTNTWTWTPTATETPTKTSTPSNACAGIPQWNGNFVSYSIGQKVQYDGAEYQCIQAHTSESSWEPNVTPALWKNLGVCGSTNAPAVLAEAAPVVYPNPATGSTTTVGLSVVSASNVSIQVYTVAMRLVHTITVGQVNTGAVTVPLIDKSGVQLADGLYYFVVHANGQSWTEKVLVLR